MQGRFILQPSKAKELKGVGEDHERNERLRQYAMLVGQRSVSVEQGDQ